MDNDFKRKLASYGALSSAFILAGAHEAEAQAIYVDLPDTPFEVSDNFNVNNNSTSSSTWSEFIVNLDMENAMVNPAFFSTTANADFAFKLFGSLRFYNSYSTNNSSTWTSWNSASAYNRLRKGSSNVIGNGAIFNLPTGAIVGPGFPLGFNAGNNNLGSVSERFEFIRDSGGNFFAGGSAPSDVTGYLGVRLDIGGQFHYGWVRIRVELDTYTANDVGGSIGYLSRLTILDYAYQTLPDTPLRVGDTQGTEPILTVTKTDALSQVAGTSLIDYTVVISNAVNIGDAMNSIFNSGIDPNTQLVVGSVETNQGTVITGNTTGDMAVQVNIGDIAPGGQVTINFQVEVLPIPGVMEISCAGSLTGDNFSEIVTDDPDTGAADDPTVTIVQIPDLDVTKSDSVYAESGSLFIQYDILIDNDANAGDALNTVFSSGVDPQTYLIAGSVTTSQGSVTTGNNEGDMTVQVDIGTVTPGQQVMVSFQVAIKPINGMLEILCAGSLTGDNFSEIVSDDPDTVDTDDPTLTEVTIPTMGQWGLIVLNLLLIIFGVQVVQEKKALRLRKKA